MKIKVLGCYGAELPGFSPPAFLIDDKMLLDAGTITSALNENSQRKISHIIITHAHLDHVRGIPALVDNMFLRNGRNNITLVGIKKTLQTVKKNLFNNNLWPDFTRIPNPAKPMLKLKVIKTGKNFKVLDYRITAERVNHSVAATGYIIESSKGKRLLYTGDTGPTANLWKRADMPACPPHYKAGKPTGRARGKTVIDGAIIEVSFPNNMREAAVRTGHLSPVMLLDELKKMKQQPQKIFISHTKPQFLNRISKELGSLKIKNLILLKEGKTYTI